MMGRAASAALITLSAGALALGACGEKEEPEAGSIAESPTSGPDASVSSGPLPEPTTTTVPDPGKPGGRLDAGIILGEINTDQTGEYEISYGIVNRGKVAIGFGVCGTLQRRENGRWVTVNTTQVCPELLAVAEPGKRNSGLVVTTPDPLEGPHRLVHEVFAQDSSGRQLTLRKALDL